MPYHGASPPSPGSHPRSRRPACTSPVCECTLEGGQGDGTAQRRCNLHLRVRTCSAIKSVPSVTRLCRHITCGHGPVGVVPGDTLGRVVATAAAAATAQPGHRGPSVVGGRPAPDSPHLIENEALSESQRRLKTMVWRLCARPARPARPACSPRRRRTGLHLLPESPHADELQRPTTWFLGCAFRLSGSGS